MLTWFIQLSNFVSSCKKVALQCHDVCKNFSDILRTEGQPGREANSEIKQGKKEKQEINPDQMTTPLGQPSKLGDQTNRGGKLTFPAVILTAETCLCL